MKKIIKRKTASVVGKFFYWLHFLPFSFLSRLPKKEIALQTLQHAGYSFPPLWESLPKLMPSNIDISIILPVYNAEKHLINCLNSILNQNTKYSYEVVCINDGSTDRSAEIIDQIQLSYNNKLKVIHQPNFGISKARNRGIIMASGKYIGFLDSDDWVSCDYIETIMSRAFETDADIVQTGHDLYNENGVCYKQKAQKNMVISSEESFFLYKYLNGYVWGGAIRKELFTDIRFPEGIRYEDMIMRLILMRKARKTTLIPNIIYHKIEHKHNITAKLSRSNTIKQADQFWLPIQIIKYQQEELDLPINDGQYFSLLVECAQNLWLRTRKLPLKIRKSMYVLTADFIQSLHYIPQQTDIVSKRTEQALVSRNFWAWYLLSISRYLSGFNEIND